MLLLSVTLMALVSAATAETCGDAAEILCPQDWCYNNAFHECCIDDSGLICEGRPKIGPIAGLTFAMCLLCCAAIAFCIIISRRRRAPATAYAPMGNTVVVATTPQYQQQPQGYQQQPQGYQQAPQGYPPK